MAFLHYTVGGWLLHGGSVKLWRGFKSLDISKQILTAKFYPSATLPTLEKVSW